MTFETMDDVRRVNSEAGRHWFEPGTLRFFRLRIGSELYGGRYFITSEQFDERSPRLYSVREAKPDGSIGTVGEFQGHASRYSARQAIKRLLSE